MTHIPRAGFAENPLIFDNSHGYEDVDTDFAARFYHD